MRSGFGIANSKGVFSGSCRKACVKAVFFLVFVLCSASYSQSLTFTTTRNNCNYGCSYSCYDGTVTISQYGGTAFASAPTPGGSTCSNGRLGISYASYGTTIRVAKDNGCFQFTPSGENFVGCDSGINFWPSICSEYGVDKTHSVTCTFVLYDKGDPDPPCSQFFPVAAPLCKGGQGLWFAANELNAFLIIGNAFPNGINSEDDDFWFATPLIPQPQGDTIPRPDGSQCLDQTSGLIYGFTVCPQGFADDYSSSSSTDENSSSSVSNICDDFPDLPECENGNNGNQSSGSGGGGDCESLNGCDWSKFTIQLEELGVSRQILGEINEAVDLLQAGYNLSQQQNNLLQGVINAVGNGTQNITGAINGGTQDIVGAINGLLDGLTGAGSGGGNGGIAEGVVGGLNEFFGDTTGTGALNDSIASWGDGFGGEGSQMGDSLGNGSHIRNRIRQSIPLDSTTFNFMGTGGQCPVWDLSFSAGIVSCSGCVIDLCNVYGFNAGQAIRAFLWLIVILGCLFMNLQVLRSGGHS